MNPCKHHNGNSVAITNLRLLRQSGEMATRLREANHLGFDQFASVAHIGRCLQPFIGRLALKSPTRPSPDKAARPYGINAPLLLVRSLLYLDLFPATTTAIATQVGGAFESSNLNRDCDLTAALTSPRRPSPTTHWAAFDLVPLVVTHPTLHFKDPLGISNHWHSALLL